MDALPHCPDAFGPATLPVHLRRPTPARTTQLLILAFGLAAGFLAGVGFVLVALGSHL